MKRNTLTRFDREGSSSVHHTMRLGILSVIVIVAGCSRAFWRDQADRDTYHILAEKTADERWNVPRVDITPDARSRFYDPYDPDKSPLPPDDPSAAQYMQQVAGMSGYKSWHKFGEVFSVENPQWLEQFALQQNVKFASAQEGDEAADATIYGIENLTLQQALELSTIHSRDYQDQIEILFLRALALTFDRFQFGVRYLGVNGAEPSVNLDHTSVPHGANDLTFNNRFGIGQALPAGGQWAVELANRTLWLFSGENGFNTASTLSYSIVQPLLFQAGRKIALEGLTQSERIVLYSTRDLARFRKEFFVTVVGGGNGFLAILLQKQTVENQKRNIERIRWQQELLREQASQRSPIAFAKLETLPGGVVFPDLVVDQIFYDKERKRLRWEGQMLPNQRTLLLNLSNDPSYRRAIETLNRGETFVDLEKLPQGVTLPPTVVGQARFDAAEKALYWQGTMSQEQEDDLLAMSREVAFQAAITELIRMRRAESFSLDLLNLQSRLLTSLNQLRDSERAYQDLLDRFKILMGLPPDFHLTVDASLLNQFQLIDSNLTRLENQIKNFVEEWAKLDENNPDLRQLRAVFQRLQNLQRMAQSEGVNLVENDFDRVSKNRDQRLDRLKTEQEKQQFIRNLARDRQLLEDIKTDFQSFSNEIEKLSVIIQSSRKKKEIRKAKIGGVGAPIIAANEAQNKENSPSLQIGLLREQLLKIVQNLQVVQIGLRVELIDIKEFTKGMEEAVIESMENRLDLMNARAQVMDARRAVEIAANRLQAGLNLRVEGDIRTRQDNKPLDFRGRQSDFRVGIGFTAPLDLVNERNAYRTAQITFQRARRDYMAQEDQIKLEIRGSWRQIQNLEKNFETARQAVRISAMQFDTAAETASAPVTGQQGGGQSVSLNLLQALDDVLSAQNDLIRIWVNYERNRLNIFQDMGIMDIDARGIWDDDVYRIDDAGSEVPAEKPTLKNSLPAKPEGTINHEPAELGAGKPAFSNIGDVRGSVLVRRRDNNSHETYAEYRSESGSRRRRVVLAREEQQQ